MKGRNVIVTGASYGIGTYIARALAAEGANLLLVARSEPQLARVAKQLDAKYLVADLAEPDAPSRIASELDRVDVLVNNAALELQRRFHTLSTDEIERIVHVDLLAPLELTRLLLPQMLANGYGRIVNISSIAGHVGFPLTDAYAASKDGLIAFARVLRNDYRPAGVSASSIILGAVKDAGIGQRTIDELGVKTSTSYMVTPEKVANAVIRALEKDKAEIVVMPGPGRLIKALMEAFPGLGPAITRISGGGAYMEKVADYREAARAPM